MVYYHADSNVSSLLAREVFLAEQVGSAEGFNVIAQTDYNDNPDAPQYEAHWQYIPESAIEGTNRYRLEATPGAEVLSSTPVETLPELNHDDPQVLAGFVEWSIEHYPADRYGLILVDHGGAWFGGFGGDYQDGEKPVLNGIKPDAVADAIEAGLNAAGVERLEFFQFASCLLGNIESMEPFIGLADLYLGAAESTFEYPANIPGSLEWLKANPGATMHEFGVEEVKIFRANRSETSSPFEIQAAYDLNALEAVIDAWAQFSTAAVADYNPLWANVRLLVNQYYASDFESAAQPTMLADMGEFVAHVAVDSTGPLKIAADELVARLERLIVAVNGGSRRAGASGLSFHYPIRGMLNEGMFANYQELAVTARSGWDAYLQTVQATAAGSPLPAISLPDDPDADYRARTFAPLVVDLVNEPEGGQIYQVLGNVILEVEFEGWDSIDQVNAGTAFSVVNPQGSTIEGGWTSRLPMLKLKNGQERSFIGARIKGVDGRTLSSYFVATDPNDPITIDDDLFLELFYGVDPESGEVRVEGLQMVDPFSRRTAPAAFEDLGGTRLTPLLQITNNEHPDPETLTDDFAFSGTSFIIPDDIEGNPFEVVFGVVPDGDYTIEVTAIDSYFRGGEMLRFPVRVDNGSYFGGWQESGDGDDWYHQPQLGWMHAADFPWVYVYLKGWLYAGGGGEERLQQWLYHLDHGWLWTGNDYFPHFWQHDSQSWMTFEEL